MPHRPTSRLDGVTRLAVARGLSIAGDGAAYVALVAAVAQRADGAIWVSVAVLATLGLSGAVSPLAGWIGDRFDRRRVMVISDLASAGCFVALAFAGAPWALLTIAALATVAQAPFVPASNAAVANLADEGGMGRAYGVLAIAGQGGNVAGPLLGGAGIAALGVEGAFLANAATFLVSAALVTAIPGRFQAGHVSSRERGRWHDGYEFVWSNALLRALVPALVAIALAMGFLIPAEVALADHFDTGTAGFGAIVSVWAVGAIVGARLAGRRPAGREAAGISIGAIALSIAFVLVAALEWFPVVLALMAVAGGGQTLMLVAAQVAIQRSTPDALRSRVSAVDQGFSQIAWAIGALGTGAVLGLTGPQLLYGLVGVAIALVVIVLNAALRGRRPAELAGSS